VEYFFLLYRLNTQDRYLIWVAHEKDTNEKDAVVVDAAGFIPTFEIHYFFVGMRICTT
jgi:hypothetical protein